jgi:hypothetical protein
MRNYKQDMTVEDFVFMSFMRGAKLINKRLRDKRLTDKRYVADRRWMVDIDPKYEESAKDDVVCWFNITLGTKRSISLDDWVKDCELMGLDWEIRQSDEKHWTVFLMLKRGWLYNKQVRSFNTIQRQHSMTAEQVRQEEQFPTLYWEIEE